MPVEDEFRLLDDDPFSARLFLAPIPVHGERVNTDSPAPPRWSTERRQQPPGLAFYVLGRRCLQCLLHTLGLIQTFSDTRTVTNACAWVLGQDTNQSLPAIYYCCCWVLVAVLTWLLESLPWSNSLASLKAGVFIRHNSRSTENACSSV